MALYTYTLPGQALLMDRYGPHSWDRRTRLAGNYTAREPLQKASICCCLNSVSTNYDWPDTAGRMGTTPKERERFADVCQTFQDSFFVFQVRYFHSRMKSLRNFLKYNRCIASSSRTVGRARTSERTRSKLVRRLHSRISWQYCSQTQRDIGETANRTKP